MTLLTSHSIAVCVETIGGFRINILVFPLYAGPTVHRVGDLVMSSGLSEGFPSHYQSSVCDASEHLLLICHAGAQAKFAIGLYKPVVWLAAEQQ